MENKIIEIAKNVFIEKGYAETSMSEIAAASLTFISSVTIHQFTMR